MRLNEKESRDLFELIHKRRRLSSTIFCSQFHESEWYGRLCSDDSPMADAIMDRISYNSYKINIESIDPKKDISMREVYGLDPVLQSKLQVAPISLDRWLSPHRTGGSAAQEYSTIIMRENLSKNKTSKN